MIVEGLGGPPQRDRDKDSRLALALLLLVLFGSCSAERGAGAPLPGEALALEELRWSGPARDTSVVLIVNDAMRRDRVGAYGGPARTPVFDAFAAQNLTFDAAYTQSPWTKPSIATLFTSLYPSQHGIVSHPSLRRLRGLEIKPSDQWMDVMSDEFETLAEVLQAAGFRTAAFVGNPWIEKRFGFGQGFEIYDDSFASWDVSGMRISRAALEWIATIQPGERFFLFLHYMDTHRPYGVLRQAELLRRRDELARAAFATAAEIQDPIANLVWLEEGSRAVDAGCQPSVDLLEMAYDRGVEHFDEALGVFLEGLAAHATRGNTAIVVTSDHGEALFSRGWGNHGNGLYEDEVAIPLAARLPGVSARGGHVRTPVGLIDLLPTLSTYLGVDHPQRIFGRGWLDPAGRRGLVGDRYLVTEGVMFRPNNRAVRHGDYKAVWQPHMPMDGKERALFEIVSDPGEIRDLLIDRTRLADASNVFNDLLRGSREAVPAVSAPRKEYVPIEPGLKDRLQSLGYIQEAPHRSPRDQSKSDG